MLARVVANTATLKVTSNLARRRRPPVRERDNLILALGDIFMYGVNKMLRMDQPILLWITVQLARTRDMALVERNSVFIRQLWKALFERGAIPVWYTTSANFDSRARFLDYMPEPVDAQDEYRLALDIISHPLGYARTSPAGKDVVRQVISGERAADWLPGANLGGILTAIWDVVNGSLDDRAGKPLGPMRFMTQSAVPFDRKSIRTLTTTPCANWAKQDF